MMRTLTILSAISFTLCFSRQLPPSSDIFLASVRVTDGAVTMGKPVNITARAGYDNQPSFLPDGGGILYTAIQTDPRGPQAPTQTDIFRYDIGTGTTTRVTATPESEYSPTVTPNGAAFSVIRVEPDSTQRLWSFALDGSKPTLLLTDIKPVGYHAWMDDSTVALFVLGTPPTLQIASLRTGKAAVVAHSIGRSLHRIPGRRAVGFVHKKSQDEWWIMEFDVASGTTRPLARTLPNSEDIAWMPDGSVVMGTGSKLFRHDLRQGSAWKEIADWTGAGIKGITRIAVSPRGDWITIVGAE
jgi:Tol biopolymer transport system component